MDGEQPVGRRTEVTRQRHGDDFYARIGRKGWELRRRARDGDPEAQQILQRRRDARDQRRAAWREMLEAKEAVLFLREELATRTLADADPARAALSDGFAYARQLRGELASAEARLAALQEVHRQILSELGLRDATGDDQAEHEPLG
jgi:hypothetical protein